MYYTGGSPRKYEIFIACLSTRECAGLHVELHGGSAPLDIKSLKLSMLPVISVIVHLLLYKVQTDSTWWWCTASVKS